MTFRRLRYATIALALFLGMACTRAQEEQTIRAIPVVVATVEARDIAEKIHAAGEILAREEASIASEGSGQVTSITVQEGQPAQTGQVVIEIDREKRQLELENQRALEAEAREVKLEQERETARIQQLYAQHVASKAQLDEAETALRKATARLQAAGAQVGLAERALRNAGVTAPFDGFIAQRFVSQGDFVQTGDKLFDLVALDPVEVEFQVRERDTSRVAMGDHVSVRVAPYPEQTFEAQVSMISPRIEPRTRTLRVKALIPNPDAKLRPGLFARVELGVDERIGVATIPEDAIVKRADRTIVYRMTGGTDRVEEVPVQTGSFFDDLVEIVHGVAVGDRIVVRGQARLVDGARVTPRMQDGSPLQPPVASVPPSEGRR